MALTFRPDIEGLRALAIVPVVVFHAFPSVLPGGYVGVDVFFVISGFLITSLLLDRLRSGRYSVASFYGARVRRIFPALFVMLALTLPLAALLPSTGWLQQYGRTLGATALFFSNMELYRTTDYFDTAAELKPLVHTWSLAVEEQYYIVFPLLLALLYRRWPKAIAPALAAIGLASLALSIAWLRSDPALAFYSALSRTFELMIGSLLAVGLLGSAAPRAWREAAAAAGLGLIVLACMLLTPRTPFPGAAALLPCLGAALMIWAGGQGPTWAGRWVAAPLLRWVGAMSFSLYLWHWPMLVLVRHWELGEPTPWQAGAAVAASVLLAWASLKWVETPVRRASHTDRRLLLGGAACILVTFGLAWVLVERTWWVRPVDARAQALLEGARDSNPHRSRCHGRFDYVIPYEERCRFGELSSPTDTVVWGDSHGAELALEMGEAAGKVGRSVAQITSSACPPAIGFEEPTRPRCSAHNAATLRALVDDGEVKRVILVAHYELYLRTQAAEFETGLRRSVAALTAAGKQVVLVAPFPTYGYPVPAALVALYRRGQPFERFGQSREAYERDQAPALAMIRRLGGAPRSSVVDTGTILCGDVRCRVVSGDSTFYFDDNHLSLFGARQLIEASTSLRSW
jgi:peptidoglycan/LPS O-acetylase OafA/YrhL